MINHEYSISLGGSVIIPQAEIRTDFIRDFTSLLKQRVDDFHQRTAIITGGGGVTRIYQKALKDLGVTDPTSLDIMGIHPTHDNALLLSFALNRAGVYTQYLSSLDERIQRNADAWVTGGTIPGQTSDAVLVDWANMLGIQTLINATNTPFIYDMIDGQIDKTHPIQDITWKEYLSLLGNRTHQPGENVPFGITASHKADQLGFSVIILDGNNLGNLQHVFEGKPFNGTRIHPNH